MEDLLQNLIKEANGSRLSSFRQSAQDALALLNSQNNLQRNPSFELRAVCFTAFRHALETKKSKLITMAITGFNKIIRDDRFQAGTEPEDDSLWLPAQLLNATTNILSHCEDTQVHILRVFLNMACGTSLALNGRLVILLVNRFGEAYENGTQPIRAAAQAAASQTLTAFCAFLDEECQEILLQQQKHKNSGSSAEMVYSKTSAVACFNEAIPVMQYISSRLEETKLLPKPNDITVFLLECLLTLVNTLPQTVHSNLHFTTFLWQRFCPSLLSLLGTPGDVESRGLTTQQSKIVYSIGIQVVRLVGRERHLRPVLEALFHRMLLLPSPSKRLEPLRAAKELLRSPARLADLLLLSGPIHRHAGDDMAIIRLIMDSIEESSQHNDPAILLASVECVRALLGSLEALCKGEGLDLDGTEMANSRYITLEQADYTGPLTYQSLARLPKPYRDVVANLKYQNDSDSSGVEGGGQVIEGETDSDCSGVTEGPEEFITHSDGSNSDEENYSSSREIKKLNNLPKILQLGRKGVDECNVDLERHNARHFVKTLQNILLPTLLSFRSSIQIDEYLQEFASKCCQHNSAQNYEMGTIMNADGVYLATYSALLLNLKLIQIGHYDEQKRDITIPVSETQFVEEIHGSGVLVYVSATWLCELYQNVIAKPLLLSVGYDPKSTNQPALISLLNDIGGMSPTQLLSDWQKLQRIRGTQETSAEVEAGTKLSRRVLTCCWGSVVSVLGSALGEKLPQSGTSAISRLVVRRARQKLRQRIKDDVVSASLEGLHKAASLSNTLKLQSRSSSILALLASSSCKNHGPKILASHALSLDVLLSKGLALGSHSSLCWPHVFNACVAVADLEHALFSKASSTQLLMVAQNPQNNVVTSTTAVDSTEKLKISYNGSSDDETCIDVYSFLQNSSNFSTSSKDANVAEIVERSGVHNTQGPGVLTGVTAAKVCCVLSTRADELFHSAALRLALPGLCSFLSELCKASYTQLFSKCNEMPKKNKKWWKREMESFEKPPPTLLLHRIGEVTLKCIRSGRPLIHTMKVWSIVGPHFMQAACHKDRTVSKKAVACIHDSVVALLNEQSELPHFHFNEALFKPFENLLCLELCDSDVQDQIVSCLCEFVEGNRTEISSGWRPLFGTLRVANSRQNAAAIVEVFKVFLQTDNTLVFANAALDYILCLLSHIRNSDNVETATENTLVAKVSKNAKNIKIQEQKIDFLDNFDVKSKENSFVSKEISSKSDLCIISLQLLQNCATILSMMFHMPKCPTFNLTHRMNIDTDPQLVDPIIQNSDIITFSQTELEPPSYKLLSLQQDMEHCEKDNLTLLKLDKSSGVLKVWYVLLEGLTSAAMICSHKNQPYILETLFKMLEDLIVNPGMDFGFYCINHLLLPMVQNWLRQTCKVPKATDVSQNFKHCCGMTSELIVEYLHHLQGEKENEHESLQTLLRKEHPGATLALKQLLLILIECISQPSESIARLGASCMRHIILNVGSILNPHQWEILVTAVHRACEISLYPLQQITLAFKPHSDSFYGDLATVKVAARKDSTVKENEKVYELAKQVFLMQNQKICTKCNTKTCDCDKAYSNFVIDDRSYVFLLYPLDMASSLNPDLYTLRVPFKSLVVGILAHQMLIQTISSALLQNLNHVTPILNILQINSCSLRGILTHVNAKHIDLFLKCLELSSERSKDFDSRPGLKFLIQKVGNLNKAANLYNQSNTSEVVQIIVLIELCLDGIQKYRITPNDIKEILAKDEKLRCTTDLKYVEKFLRNLQTKWEYLCESYVNLRLNILEERSEIVSELNTSEEVLNEEIPEDNYKEKEVQARHTSMKKPFKLGDFKRSDSFTSSDSESYLEKSPFTNLKSDEDKVKVVDSDKEEVSCKTKLLSRTASNSEDDENHKLSPQVSKKITKESLNYKMPINSIKYDANTLMQMRATISVENITPKLKDSKRTMSESYEIDKDIEQKIETMMEQYRRRKTNHFITSTPSKDPFNITNSLPPPQSVPPEIQHQRAISIFKDLEIYKSARIETMEACMELLCSLPSEKISPLAMVLKQGALMLIGAQEEKVQVAAEKLLQKMNISFIEDDNISV